MSRAINLVDNGLEVLGDLTLPSHWSYVSGYTIVIPCISSPAHDAIERVPFVLQSVRTDLEPLRGDFLHGMAKLALVSQAAEVSVSSLPPFPNCFTSFKAILTCKGTRHSSGETLKDGSHVSEATSRPRA